MRLSAVLLAGGRSRRMGVDKATIRVGNEPLWARQLRVLQALSPETVWLSCREVPQWCPPDLEVVVDQAPSRGPLSGLAAALARLRTTHLLVLAIDLPCITDGHLRELWEAAEPGVGVLPSNQAQFEPLCAIYPREAGALAQSALKSGEFSLQQLAGLLVSTGHARCFPIPPSLLPLYLNANTPADLTQF